MAPFRPILRCGTIASVLMAAAVVFPPLPTAAQDAAGADYLESRFVITNPRGVLDFGDYSSATYSQTVERVADTAVVITTRVARRLPSPRQPYPLPALADEMARYTKPTSYIQSDHPAIARIARTILADTRPRTQHELVLAVLQWNRGHLRYALPDEVPDAITVLERGSGNCIGFAHLPAAILRHLGVPTRNMRTFVAMGARLSRHYLLEVYYPEDDLWLVYEPQRPGTPASTNIYLYSDADWSAEGQRATRPFSVDPATRVRAGGISATVTAFEDGELERPATLYRRALVGGSVALGGNLAAVGVHDDSRHSAETGYALLYERRPDGWQYAATLTPDDPHERWLNQVVFRAEGRDLSIPFRSRWGTSRNGLHIHGDIAMASSTFMREPGGALYIFERAGDRWRLAQRLDADAEGGLDSGVYGRPFGASIAFDGQRLLVADHITPDRSEDVHLTRLRGLLYELQDGAWRQVAVLEPETPLFDREGPGVALAGDMLLIGGHVYERGQDGAWREVQRLVPPEYADTRVTVGRELALHGSLLLVATAGTVHAWELRQNRWHPAGLVADGVGQTALATDGRLAYVGRYSMDGGPVEIYEPDGRGGWRKLAAIEAAQNSGIASNFGALIGFAGDQLLIGAPNHRLPVGRHPFDYGPLMVYSPQGGEWREVARYLLTPARSAGRKLSDDVGAVSERPHVDPALAWDGDRLLMAVRGDFAISRRVPAGESSGGPRWTATTVRPAQAHIAIFRRGDDGWTVADRIPAPTGSTTFGLSMAVDGDRLAVGDPFADSGMGEAYVYQRDSGGSWHRPARLRSPAPRYHGWFGEAIAISGDLVVVGEPDAYARGANNADGRAYVFERGARRWSEGTALRHLDPAANDGFGVSLAAAPGFLAVGAYLKDTSAGSAGAVYLFRREGSGWAQAARITPEDAGQDFEFGGSLVAAGDQLAVSAHRAATHTGIRSGAIYLYRMLPTGEIEELRKFMLEHGKTAAPIVDAQGQPVASRSTQIENLGFSLDFDGVTLVSGASGMRASGYEPYNDFGSAFTFAVPEITPWERIGAALADAPALETAFPNPFHTTTDLVFQIVARGPVELTVRDAQGRALDTLLTRTLEPGRYRIPWIAANTPPGDLIFQLRTAGATVEQSAILLDVAAFDRVR